MNALFTVVVCTRDRAAELARCLEALEVAVSQCPCPVVVVDNGSGDGTADLCRRYQDRPWFNWFVCETPGLSHARNAGMNACQTPFIVYLDDDARPDPHWAKAIEQGIARWTPDFFGGPVRPYYVGAKPGWFLDEFGSNHTELREGLLDPGSTLTGCNMGWRLELLKTLGGFSPDLGMVGRSLRLGEETALMMRAYATRDGVRAVFLEQMTIEHLYHRSRMTIPYMFRRSWTYGWQLPEIAPGDHLLSTPSFKLLKETKLGLPLLLRAFVRDRAVTPHYRTYVALYAGRFGMYFGLVARRLLSSPSPDGQSLPAAPRGVTESAGS